VPGSLDLLQRLANRYHPGWGDRPATMPLPLELIDDGNTAEYKCTG
jgi:hypothetical protein